MRTHVIALLWGVAVVNCHLAGDVDEVEFVDDLECLAAVDCKGTTECQMPRCDEGVCGAVDAPESTPCGGGVCDGEGSCVACLDNGDCESGRCDDHECVAAACGNEEQDGDETDVDCGGADCAGCAEGQSCERDEDCAGGRCDESTCQACGESEDCDEQQYCDDASGECAPRKPLGAACAGEDECLEGLKCEDEVCGS